MSAVEELGQVAPDPIGTLRNNLTGYEPTAVVRELLQNADDACATQGVADAWLKVEFHPDRLVASNPSMLTDEDWERVRNPNRGGKRKDAGTTGEFGVGFWSVLHLTDDPTITSGTRRQVLNPMRITGHTVKPAISGTVVELPYRTEITELAADLEIEWLPDVEELVAAFVSQGPDLLLFTACIDRVCFVLPDGSTIEHERGVEDLGDGIQRSSIRSSDGALVEHLLTSGDIDDPPPGRRAGVQVAFEIVEDNPKPGRVFCTFPTEVQSGVHLSINGHFAPTSDRRSLEQSGTKGEWNDRIFSFAGTLVGARLAPLLVRLSAADPDRYLQAVRAFVPLAEANTTVERRAEAFLDEVDAAAWGQPVILDRTGLWRRGDESVLLPPELDDLIAEEVDGCTGLGADDDEREVLQRWGAKPWGPAEVASWLGAYAPAEVTHVAEAPRMMRDPDAVVEVLDFCGANVGPLDRRGVLLGTDEHYHPVGAALHRITDDRYADLVVGLSRPVLDRRFDRLPISDRCRPVAAQWLREALIEDQDRLVGSRVPLPSFGVAERQSRVIDALDLLIAGNASIEGIPLALDPGSRLQIFDDRTVGDVPDGPYRKQIEHLCERLGLRIVHKVIDDTVKGRVHRFSLSVIPETQPTVRGWNPREDSPLILDAISALGGAGPISEALVEQLRNLPIWPTTKRKAAPLTDVYLPQLEKHAVQVKLRDEHVLPDIFGGEGGKERHRVMRERLGVEVLDRVEELVRSCLDGAGDAGAQEDLVSLLAREQLSRTQRDRLSEGPFVPTLRAGFRPPAEVILTTADLPLELGDRTITPKLCADPEVVAFLKRLGARPVPSTFDLNETATQIARMPLAARFEADPGVVLLKYLRDGDHGIEPDSLKGLGSIAWLVASDVKGTRRVRPKDAIDPGRQWAHYLYPYPVGGVGTLSQELRRALGMRYELTVDELSRIAHAATTAGEALPGDFFYQLERASTHEQNERELKQLSSLKLIPLGGGGFAAPDDLIAPALAEIWGHLRQQVPSEYADRYPNLLRVWRVSDSVDEVRATHHVQVLESIADRYLDAELLPDRDRRLAEARLASIASFVAADEFDPNEVDLPVLTTMGVRRASTSFRGDLSHDVIVRLGSKVPVILESTQTAGLLARLEVQSLRRHVQLEPTTSRATLDTRWDQRLAIQRTNVIRFLLHSADVDESILEHWPPKVHKVQSLQVTASLAGEILDEWRADAFLGWQSERLVLHVQGDASASALGRAMAQVFGIAPGTNALLRGVLDTDDAELGEDLLDEDRIPPLPEGRYEYEPEQVEPLPPEHDDEWPRSETTTSDPAPDPTWAPEDDHVDENEASSEEGASVDEAIDDPELPEGPSDDDNGADLSDGQVLPPDDLASPRGTTDELALEARGFRFVDVDDEDVPDEEWTGTSGNSADTTPTKVCLSYYAWAHGLVPIKAGAARELAGGAEVEEVVLFGDLFSARQASADYLRIDGGHEVFVDRLVPPGAVIYLEPGAAGRIELQLVEQPHTVTDVWMLELDDAGNLIRTHLDAIEVPYETQGPVYKAERRFEDINALLAEVQAQPKSARQLIIEVFERFGADGLTEPEVWDLVAMHRLFARATISRELAEQFGLFSRKDGRWYLTGTEIRRARRRRGGENQNGGGDGVPSDEPRPRATDDLKKASQLVKQLRQLLARLPRERVIQLGQELGFAPQAERGPDLDEAVASVLAGSAPEVIGAIHRELTRNPEAARSIVERLTALDPRRLDRARELIAVVVERGDPGSVAHARQLLDQADALSDSGDPVERAEALLVRAEAAEDASSADVTGAQAALTQAYQRSTDIDSFDAPLLAIERLVRLERAHRRLRRIAQSDQAGAARSDLLAHYLGQVGDASAHDTEDRQWCRAFVNLLSHKLVDALDDLAELGKRWDRSPQRAGDAAHVRRLMVRFADVKHIENAVVRVAARAPKGRGPISPETRDLAAQWAAMAGISSNW